MSSAHMQSRQLWPEGPVAQPSRGALTNFSLVLWAGAQTTGTGKKYAPAMGSAPLKSSSRLHSTPSGTHTCTQY